MMEYEICIANDWNLNQGSGAEILNIFMNITKTPHDYNQVAERVNVSAMRNMFSIKSGYQLNAPKQSSLFLAHLRQICEQF